MTARLFFLLVVLFALGYGARAVAAGAWSEACCWSALVILGVARTVEDR